MNVMNQSFSDEEKQRMHDEINADFFGKHGRLKKPLSSIQALDYRMI
ncbi:hypothetical protein P4S72_27325 [Vibrio sp. PP-XX7]